MKIQNRRIWAKRTKVAAQFAFGVLVAVAVLELLEWINPTAAMIFAGIAAIGFGVLASVSRAD